MSQPRRAFTLVEMTLVIMILGLLAAISMPRISTCVLAAHLRTAAATIESHLDHARSVAINQGRTVTITFDNSLARYQSSEVGFPEQPGSLLSVDLRAEFGTAIELQANFDGNSTISFDSEGMPRVAGAVLTEGSVDLGAEGMRHRITIHPGLGLASRAVVSTR